MLRNTAWAFAAQVVRLITTVILIRLLAPNERGFQTLFLLLPILASSLAMLSIPGAMAVVLNRGVEADRLFRNVWGFALVLALVGCLVWWPLLPSLARYLNHSSQGRYDVGVATVALGLLVFIPTLLGDMVRGWLVAIQRVQLFAWSQICQAITQLLLVLVLVWLWQGGAWGAVWATIGGLWVGLLVALLAVGNAGNFKPRLERPVLRSLLRISLIAHLGNVVQLLNYRLDALLIGGILSATAVGLYAVAVSLAELVWLVPQAVAMALLPRVAAGGAALTPQAARHTLLLAGFGAPCLLLLAWPLLLVNPAYMSAWPILALLLPGVVALSLSKVLASDLSGRGKPQYASLASIVSLGVTIAGNLLLMPRLGIVGAACVSSIAYSLTTLLITRSYLRVSGTTWQSLVPSLADLQVYPTLLRRLRRGDQHLPPA